MKINHLSGIWPSERGLHSMSADELRRLGATWPSERELHSMSADELRRHMAEQLRRGQQMRAVQALRNQLAPPPSQQDAKCRLPECDRKATAADKNEGYCEKHLANLRSWTIR